MYKDRDLSCARWMYFTIAESYPGTTEPSFQDWAEIINAMRNQDLRTYQQIHQLFTWALSESYIDQAFTPAYLRDNFANLTNIMNRKSSRIIPPPEYYEILQKSGIKIDRKLRK